MGGLIFESPLPSFGWYFYGIDGKQVGPYNHADVAEEKYWEYRAYTVDAPECHHP